MDLNLSLGLESPVECGNENGICEEILEIDNIPVRIYDLDVDIPKRQSFEKVRLDEVEDEEEYSDVKSVKIEKEEIHLKSVKIEKEETSGDENSNSLHEELTARLVDKGKNPMKDEAGVSSDGEPSFDIDCEALEAKLSVGNLFVDLETVYILYCEYARCRGFSVRRGEQRYFGKSEAVRWKQFCCSCNGLPNYSSVKHRLNVYKKLVIRTECNAKLTVAREDLGRFMVITFETEHNHNLVRSDQSYLLRSSRNLNYAKKSVLDALNSVGIGVSKACEFLEKESGGVQNVGFTRKDAYNHADRKKKQTRLADGDAWMLVDHLTNKSNAEPFFWWKYALDDDGRILNVFWRDTRCAVDYDAFGDVLSVDTTFRTNRYDLVAAPFVGINHHGNNVMFGMALMSDETNDSFIWLFQTFLESMHGKQPKMIFTDQCRAMMNAIDEIFPKAKHRLCQWHISRNCAQNFGPLNGDSSFKRLWHKCMNVVEDADAFDETWAEMMRYEKIAKPNWFKGMYDLRHRWASVFSRGMFSAGMLATSRSESTNNALKNVVKAKIPLIEFVHKYEEIQKTWRTKESAEDAFANWLPGQFVEGNSLLIHAATIYTRNIYKSVELAVAESFNVVLDETATDLGDDNLLFIARPKDIGSYRYEVVFNIESHYARCGCGFWEIEGLICSHIVKVYDRRNVKAIPEKLILHRWTKKAKRDFNSVSDGSIGGDSSVMSYMSFANETMRFVYDIVSCGFQNKSHQGQIVERMKSLRTEFGDMWAATISTGPPPSRKKYATADGAEIQDPKTAVERRFANASQPKPRKKRTPKSMASRSYAKKSKKVARSTDDCMQNNAGPSYEFHPHDLHELDLSLGR